MLALSLTLFCPVLNPTLNFRPFAPPASYVRGTFAALPKAAQSARRKAVAGFASGAHAAKAVATLDLMGKQPTLGNQPLHAEQVLSAKFKLLNPVFRGQWLTLTLT